MIATTCIALLLCGSPRADEEVIDTGPVRLIQLAEGIYAVSPNFAGANGAVILAESGSIVVDTHGSPASARALIDAVGMLSDDPVRYVVNTHWHIDHHTGNLAYREVFGDDVIFISHDQTRAEIPTLGAEQFGQARPFRSMPVQKATKALETGLDQHGEPLSADQVRAVEAFRKEQTDFAESVNFDYILADLTYSKSLTLHGGPNTAEVFFLYPAHTASDTIVYIPDEEILIVGDLLTQPIIWSWSSYPSTYAQTLKALEQLPVKKIVIGHGGPVLDGKAYLKQVRLFLDATVAYAANSHSVNLSAAEAIEAARRKPIIESFRRQFVSEAQDGMFDQMVAWTIERAYIEL